MNGPEKRHRKNRLKVLIVMKNWIKAAKVDKSRAGWSRLEKRKKKKKKKKEKEKNKAKNDSRQQKQGLQ